jgi:hypothetical protein
MQLAAEEEKETAIMIFSIDALHLQHSRHPSAESRKQLLIEG